MIRTHYIVVRRDLSLATLLVMVAHAAGESFYALGPRSSVKEHAVSNGEVAGSSPAGGSTFDPAETRVVILGARNEHKLDRLQMSLRHHDVPFIAVHEPDAPWHGQLMAIGLLPGDAEQLRPLLNEFQRFPDGVAVQA